MKEQRKMKNKIVVREYRSGDVQALASIYSFTSPKPFVATIEEEVVGFAEFEPTESYPLSELTQVYSYKSKMTHPSAPPEIRSGFLA